MNKKLHKIRFLFTNDGFDRANYLRKHKLLHSIGDNVFFQPRKLPDDSGLISLGDNVVIASDVTFVCHDVMNIMFNYIEDDSTSFYCAPINIGNNVFIGSKSIILPNVNIEDNVIIGAGSIVTKDIKSGSVVAGAPVKKIGDFNNIFDNRKKMDKDIIEKRYEIAWKNFFNGRNNL